MSRYKLTREQYNGDQQVQADARKKAYDLNPRLCKHCNSPLPYLSKNKFCNNSCSASFSNTARTKTQTKINATCVICGEIFTQPSRPKRTCSSVCAGKLPREQSTLVIRNPSKPKKIQKGNVGGDADFSLVYLCRCCGKYFSYKITKYCQTCQPNIRMYRARCEFKFNVFDYPDHFDINLLNTAGWYSPGGKKGNKVKNTTGVARDHLYTVADGFKNGVDPELLAHPANCQLILQEDNVRKRDTSTITLDELKLRIANWK